MSLTKSESNNMQFITVIKKTIIQPSYFQKIHFQPTNCPSIHRPRLLSKQSSGFFKQTLGQRLIHFILISFLAPLSILPVMAADIEAANNNTSIFEGATGVPVIDIATPNAAGISHNSYQQFNVGEQGTVLNNSTAPQTMTTLGGSIANNPNLMGQAARVIINEVVANNPSVLNGALEVAGQEAWVIVANPYGITCDGCGFINTPHAGLTTGQSILVNGEHGGDFVIKKGIITFMGKGIDARQSPILSLASRAMQIDALIQAQKLNVLIGTNRININSGWQNQAGRKSGPVLALDTGDLGGMHADKILLIANNKGAGVNLHNLMTKTDDLKVDAAGNIRLGITTAKKTLRVSGETLHLVGTQSAGDDMILSSRGMSEMENNTLSAGNKLELIAGGEIILDKSTMTANHDLSIQGVLLSSGHNASIQSKKDLKVVLSGSAFFSGEMTANKGQLEFSSRSLNYYGSIAAEKVYLTTTESLNVTGSIVGTKNVVFSSADYLHLNGSMQSDHTMTLKAANIATDNELRGQWLNVEGGNWNNKAEVWFTGGAQIKLKENLHNNSALMTHGELNLTVDALHNKSEIYADTLRLGGREWTNSGDVHIISEILTNKLHSMNNQGSLVSGGKIELNDSELSGSGHIITNYPDVLGKQKKWTGGKIDQVSWGE